MVVSRRDCLLYGAMGMVLAGCAPIARELASHPAELPLPSGDVSPETRLLNRAAFGPRPGDVARVRSQGFDAYVDEELLANKAESPSLLMQIQREDVGQIEDPDIEDLPQGEVIRQLQQVAILRAVYGENQLKERMVDLWTNHFNVYAKKGDSAFRKGTEERDVIRKHALATFPSLLNASAKSVAMLAFLDNTQNINLHPNENYARELMELHTLGIGGGYTQRDVQEVARCFTGWMIENRFLRPKGTLRFDPERHDDGPKLVLGHVIPAGGGKRDVDSVLSILSAHPSTARFVAKKLVVYFYGEENSSLVTHLASVYGKTGGSIPDMVRPLLAPSVLSAAPPKVKRPFDFLASAIRSTGGDTDGNLGVQEHLIAMGEPVYQWPMPDGYPVRTASWTGSMLLRWNFAHELAHGEIRGTSAGTVHDLESCLLGVGSASGGWIRSLGADGKEKMALMLASPEFQWC